MKPEEALSKLDELLRIGRETEVVEWKEAKYGYGSDDLGKYFSALSNEANLRGKQFAWFIMGIADDGTIVGTNYRPDDKKRDSIKHENAEHVSSSLTFREIHEIAHPNGSRVLLFQIPAAPRGIPISWKEHYYGRDGSSLTGLNLEKIEAIRNQSVNEDWSIGICENANIEDLDPEAIRKAREQFVQKNERLAQESNQWDDATFLNKAKLIRQGKITRAAIILLGRPESESFLTPAVAKITWILKDEKGQELDYAHFGPPWILNGDEAYRRIRNLRYRHMPDGSLFPIEVDKYDSWVLREALHNCMAHQDYTKGESITLVEFPDKLLLENAGFFIPQSIEAVIERDAPESRYRNRFLYDAMVNLNMIDTIGSGIKKMFQIQMDRYFPLPDYDIRPNRVGVTIMGHILDPHYVQHLASELGLPLHDVMLLDKIQKGKPIKQKDVRRLRARNLVEGRSPRLHISSSIAALSKQQAVYLQNRGLDNQHYVQLVIEHIRKFERTTRRQADELLITKLPNVLDDKQKKDKVHNILSSMVRDGLIKNVGTRPKPNYIIVENNDSDV
ncbi:MAG: hypothetical protein IEMM0002_0667 [bacterium]|nr:MAG: hypothetical protein IEMM0002_0667 [bacterium]